jgi:hypothetical protein
MEQLRNDIYCSARSRFNTRVCASLFPRSHSLKVIKGTDAVTVAESSLMDFFRERERKLH